MNSRLYGITLTLLGSLGLLSTGCTQKDLNNNAPTTIADNVRVVFDWSKAPDKQAKTMVLYLYSDAHAPMDYAFKNVDGDIIRTYGGKHTAVCHSNDDPYTHYVRNSNNHDEFEIYTDNSVALVGQGISTRGIPRARGAEDEPLRIAPSMIYGAQSKEIDLKVSGLPQTITFYPEELICHYTVEFVDVKNLQSGAYNLDATISSLAGGYYPGRMCPTSESVTNTFTLSAHTESNSLRADFLTFGVPDGEDREHKIILYVALQNAKGGYQDFDVTDQVNNAPDPRHVKIVIPGLELPDIPDPPKPPTGGMNVEVDSWETFYFGIKV